VFSSAGHASRGRPVAAADDGRSQTVISGNDDVVSVAFALADAAIGHPCSVDHRCEIDAPMR
jgi:hypothetical protein